MQPSAPLVDGAPAADDRQLSPSSTALGPVRLAWPPTSGAPQEPILSLAVRGADPAAVIEVSGELDITTAWQLTKQVEQILQDQPREQVVLDLAELRCFSVAGVDALLWIRAAVATAASHLVLRNPPKIVCKILDITDTIDAFDIRLE